MVETLVVPKILAGYMITKREGSLRDDRKDSPLKSSHRAALSTLAAFRVLEGTTIRDYHHKAKIGRAACDRECPYSAADEMTVPTKAWLSSPDPNHLWESMVQL